MALNFPLIVFHCQECEISLDLSSWHEAEGICGSGLDGLFSQGWDLLLVTTWHKSEVTVECVKLLFT